MGICKSTRWWRENAGTLCEEERSGWVSEKTLLLVSKALLVEAEKCMFEELSKVDSKHKLLTDWWPKLNSGRLLHLLGMATTGWWLTRWVLCEGNLEVETGRFKRLQRSQSWCCEASIWRVMLDTF